MSDKLTTASNTERSFDKYEKDSLGSQIYNSLSPKDFSNFTRTSESAPGLPEAHIDLENGVINFGDDPFRNISGFGKYFTQKDNLRASDGSSRQAEETAPANPEIRQKALHSVARTIAHELAARGELSGAVRNEMESVLLTGASVDEIASAITQRFAADRVSACAVAKEPSESGIQTLIIKTFDSEQDRRYQIRFDRNRLLDIREQEERFHRE